MPVSAVDCVQPALQHTREQLFTRFRWGQWSRFALIGLLAAELHVGGCSVPNLGSLPGMPHKNQSGITQTLAHSFYQSIVQPALARKFSPFDAAQISQHIAPFLGLIALAILAFVVFVFGFLYINSVFRFILFDSVLQRHCSIGEGWRKWRRAGGRFFLWQLVFQIAIGMFFVVIIGIPLVLAFAAGWATDIKQHIARAVVGVLLLLFIFLVVILTAAIVQALAKDFLVPVMALENLDFADGWHRLMAIIRPEKGRFIGYLALKFVLAIAAGIIFTIAAVFPVLLITVPAVIAVIAGKAAGLGFTVTTISLMIIGGSVLFFLMMYLIALVSVPATVFFPAYAIHFLAARYPTLDALLHPAPIVPEPQLPPLVLEPPPLPPTHEPIG